MPRSKKSESEGAPGNITSGNIGYITLNDSIALWLGQEIWITLPYCQ